MDVQCFHTGGAVEENEEQNFDDEGYFTDVDGLYGMERYVAFSCLEELLEEAGFSKVRFLLEREDEDGDGTGNYYEPKDFENEGLWWGYVAAER